MGEGSAHRGRQIEVSRPHPVEVNRARLVELSRARQVELSSSCRAQLVSPGQVFLDSMENPLSQESIHMPEEDIRCQTEVSDQARHVEVYSSIQSARLG